MPCQPDLDIITTAWDQTAIGNRRDSLRFRFHSNAEGRRSFWWRQEPRTWLDHGPRSSGSRVAAEPSEEINHRRSNGWCLKRHTTDGLFAGSWQTLTWGWEEVKFGWTLGGCELRDIRNRHSIKDEAIFTNQACGSSGSSFALAGGRAPPLFSTDSRADSGAHSFSNEKRGTKAATCAGCRAVYGIVTGCRSGCKHAGTMVMHPCQARRLLGKL